ncbi:MAG: type II toxin-antitoxin system VapC family toxin, partial [Aquificae bacterium]|nr:type II toxin-antitoxin system VapC family toxin [Aquificota bacterium]
EKYAVLDLILAETYSVLTRRCRERKYDCKKAVETLQALEKELLVIQVPLKNYHHRVVEKLKVYPQLNYNDWLLLLYAQDKNLKVLTLDKKLKEKLPPT